MGSHHKMGSGKLFVRCLPKDDWNTACSKAKGLEVHDEETRGSAKRHTQGTQIRLAPDQKTQRAKGRKPRTIGGPGARREKSRKRKRVQTPLDPLSQIGTGILQKISWREGL